MLNKNVLKITYQQGLFKFLRISNLYGILIDFIIL